MQRHQESEVGWIAVFSSALLVAVAALPAAAGPQSQRSPEDIFEQAAPGVATVEIPGDTMPASAPSEVKAMMHEIDRAFGNTSAPTLRSGFVVDKAGFVLTACHGVIGEDRINVRLKDGRTFPANVIGSDVSRDLCLLQIDVENVPALELGDSGSLRPGQRVVTIGAPEGLAASISDGVLSSIRNDVGQQPMLLFTAPVSPGNSGGPLLDDAGRVIGVITMGSRPFILAQNMNFAVPINDAKPLIASRPVKALAIGPSATQDAEGLSHQAEQAFSSGETTRAIELWQQAIAVEPRLASAHLNLGRTYLMGGRYDDGRKEISKALLIDPNLPTGNTLLCVAYSRTGSYGLADVACEKAIAQDPNDAAAYQELGIIYQQLGAITKASEALDKASEMLGKAVALDPNNPEAHAYLGMALADKGDINQAAAEVEKAVALNPKSVNAQYAATIVTFQHGEYPRAMRHYDQAVALGASFDPEFTEKLMSHR